ncbi:MAG TPA: nuclear transport factor 2 family protein [Chthoniobacterales bacterium]|jgi:ketosteroid isomerase-like protein|nr:nuclear transport factor 2 family protein [Chthoniobacterales bacterium]
MPEQENVELIRRLYEAFGKGDINTIIDHLAGQFVWRFDAPSTVPFAGDFKTPDEVRLGFFGSLAETQKDQSLKPEEFIAHDDKVVMIGRYSAVVTATNKRFNVPLVHVFTIQNGKVTRYLNFTDSASIAEAYKTG